MPKFTAPLVAIAIFTVSVSDASAQARYSDDQIDPAHKNPIRIRDIANRPCITIKGSSVPDKVRTNVVNHYVRAANGCPKAIKIKVCYTQSTRCVEFALRSLERKEVLLGTTTTTTTSMPMLSFDFLRKRCSARHRSQSSRRELTHACQ